MGILMKKGRIFFVGILSAAIISASNSAGAFEGKQQHGKEKQDEIISKMSLTPRQKKEIIETQEIQKDQLGKIRRALRQKRADLANELKKDKLNYDDVKYVADDIKDLQGQLIDNRISHFIRLRKILTKEQMGELLDSYKMKS